jgi:hypothetical protein
METARASQSIISHVNTSDDHIRWFSGNGCVVWTPTVMEVFVDGTLVSRFEPDNLVVRNMTLVGLSMDPQIKKGKLASAFGIGAEQLRRLNRRFETDGVDGVHQVSRRRGRKTKVTPAMREKLHGLFEEDFSAHEAFIELENDPEVRDPVVSYPVVCRVRRAWLDSQDGERAADGDEQLDLEGLIDEEEAEVAPEPVVEDEPEAEPRGQQAGAQDQDEASDGQAPQSGRNVRNLGSWLLVAMVHAFGLHTALLSRWKSSKRNKERLRVVVDAVIMALGIGQRCVEGVRRLEASSGDVLLRAARVPSESWSRRVLKTYVEESSVFFAHLAMTQNYLELAAARRKGATVFYVDNHMRPYTGKHTIRKGWRMQDKRVLPGVSDYYVHDEDGRPVYRLDVPSNDSLTAWLTPVAQVMRVALGKSQRILLAFDRAGAYPKQLAALRDAGFECVTYERRPYPLLSPASFDEQVLVETKGAKKPEVIGVHESRHKNLGKGRGRVRRIALLMPDGHQVNLLAVSREPKERLIEVMLGRWIQENGFKHGNERWGINQLDRRRVEPYPPDAVIPNPARRRADNALRLARHREGDARNKLARMKSDHPRRAKVEQDLAEALEEQHELEAQRPSLPKHAPLRETELKGKLVYHPGNYKVLIDTIRIACANGESELATVLAPALRRPREAKKVLANIFTAPGQVRVNGKSITVTLDPTGNRNELEAIEELFDVVNGWKLTLPGDAKKRPLRFRSHLL